MPENAGRHRTPRRPRVRPFDHLRGRRAVREAGQILVRGVQGHVARRPHIGTAQRHQQIGAGRPGPDSGQRGQGAKGLGISESRNGLEIERPVDDGLGQNPAISSLLPAEPDAAQRRIVEAEQGCRRNGRHGLFQFLECSARGCERDLLLEDQQQQSRETRLPRPQRRRSNPFHDATQNRISMSEFEHASPKRRLIEDQTPAHPHRSPTDPLLRWRGGGSMPASWRTR